MERFISTKKLLRNLLKYCTKIQCFFRLWNVNVDVLWTWFCKRSRPSNYPHRFWPFHGRLWAFLVIKRSQTVEHAHGTVENVHKHSLNAHTNGQERWTIVTLNGTFASEPRNALERIVINVHVEVSKSKDTLYLKQE